MFCVVVGEEADRIEQLDEDELKVSLKRRAMGSSEWQLELLHFLANLSYEWDDWDIVDVFALDRFLTNQDWILQFSAQKDGHLSLNLNLSPFDGAR